MPLWLKAVDITAATGLNRLGAFHTLMSYLGSIGRMMDGSGLVKLRPGHGYSHYGWKKCVKGSQSTLRG